jgi:cytochrome P450
VLRGSEHAHRRRLWNRGMSTESLKQYELIIEKRAYQLVHSLEKQCGREILLTKCLNYFTYVFHLLFNVDVN